MYALEKQSLDGDADRADDDWHDDKRRPVTDAEILQQHERDECAHHVLRAVRKVDDVEHAENHGKSEAQQRVKRAVDQAEQELPEQCLGWNAEDFEHRSTKILKFNRTG